ncbi:MAG: inositol monophosphatase [Spirochaetales bacterium]|nr:inositol monophosphatase [Spirochaetales bacterium]
MIKIEKILHCAREAGQKAGAIHKKYATGKRAFSTKSGSYDILTQTDLEAEKVIVDYILSEFPGHNILAEENKYVQSDSPYLWIIDPLDGTSNYAHGLPHYSVSIACAYEKQIIAGVVFDSAKNEEFYASMGQGAFLNGHKISVSENSTLKTSLLITGFFYSRGQEMLDTLENIRLFMEAPIHGIRRLGSAALDLAYVAAGRAEGYWEYRLNPWDFSAGKIILEESGGKITNQQGKGINIEASYIVGSNNLIHKDMLGILNRGPLSM